MAEQPLLTMRGIVKAFPGVRALDEVDFTLRAGEVHTLMGENGAGKSTLIKVLTGVYKRDAGSMTLNGAEVHPKSTQDAQALGISTVYQEVNLLPNLSVAENLSIGREPRKLGMIDWREARRRASKALAMLELDLDVTLPIRSYSIAIQQMIAIARAVDQKAKVLILDEPTSSLDKSEVQQLFRVMRRLRDEGLGIVFVSHFLDQVYEISDRLTVLRNGKLIGEYEAASLSKLDLISKMIGVDTDQVEAMGHTRQKREAGQQGPVLLKARGLSRKHAVDDVDLCVREGEIIGLAGLLGSGRSETARMLFGIDRPDAGSIEVSGKRITKHGPREAIRHRIAFTPEDRKDAGIIPELSVRENIVLALQARRGWLRRVPAKQQQALADRYIKALNIATPDADKPIGQLSGGNQQKVILGRWLATEPKVLMLDEPTRGIDVGAKAEIEKLIAELCEQGMGVLFISSELEEVLRDSHRVVVLRDRTKVGELSDDAISMDRVMTLIAGDAQEVAFA
ncbi:MAG: sugar ABC transporter ATP-binding protein [Planctomycetota bacterium]